MQPDDAPQAVRGHVKWFDPGKGYGFVVADGGGPDILLHANVLRNYGQSTVADGVEIEVEAQRTQRGVQAVAVRWLAPPAAAGGTLPLADMAEVGPETLAALDQVPARVKWFDKGKGFGFANAFGSSDDIFLHVEVLRRSGLADLAPGEAVCLRMIEGRRGLMAVEISPWEAGTCRTRQGAGSDRDGESGL
ncbi:MAG: CspA family cold shock protein [Rubellimicrobium sp.]|nr:CspA family cold shock protein [Rubellimicrobium sp.]